MGTQKQPLDKFVIQLFKTDDGRGWFCHCVGLEIYTEGRVLAGALSDLGVKIAEHEYQYKS